MLLMTVDVNEDLVRRVLHNEAVRFVELDPRRRKRVLEVLDGWKNSTSLPAGHVDAWTAIVQHSDWSGSAVESDAAAALRQHSPLTVALPASIRVAVSTAVRQSGAKTLKQLDLAALQQAKAAAAIEELLSKGVIAEVIGSLAWGQWDPTRSDVDVLVIEQGSASFSDVDDVLGMFVGPRVDILYLNRLNPSARELILQQRREHGRRELT